MRAPGDPQGVFANESQMDLIAKRLRMDPAHFRRMNLMRDGDESPVGRKISHIKARETLDRLLRESKYYSPKKPNVGRGLDRKSTRLNASQLGISYAVFCL